MTRIPKTLHYIFGMAPDFGGKPWSLVHHVCLKSAVERIRPDRVRFYYEFEPAGPWWELSKPLVDPVKIKAPTEIFGRPLCHVAHQADVVRLQVLIEHGGIYLDADVFVQKSFDDLLGYPAALGQEGEGASWGTANAVILAEPGSAFLKRWLAEYKNFRSKGRDEYWSEHSVTLPSKMASLHPQEVRILSHKAFFWPLWTDEHLHWIFGSTRAIPLEETYANHLWEARAWKYLNDLTPGEVRSVPSNFHTWVTPMLSGVPDQYGAAPIMKRLRKAARRALNVIRTAKYQIVAKVERLLRRVARMGMNPSQARQDIFSEIYSHKLWGGDNSSKFFSGVGSRGGAAATYADRMAELLQDYIKEVGRPITIVDLGCGDFQVGRALLERLPEVSYVGCDIVPQLIEFNSKTYGKVGVRFQRLDIVTDELPEGDVCLVRQVLQHLSNADISAFLRKQKYARLYVTEGQPTEIVGPANPDKLAGADVRFDWRAGKGRGVELAEPPFNCEVSEVFRAEAPPHELIVTQKVTRSPVEHEVP